MSGAASRVQKIQEAMENLTAGTPDVTGCALVTEDGLLIASVLPADTDEDSVGRMASVLLSLGTRVASDLALGDLEQVMIRCGTGNALLVGAGEDALLMVLMNRRAKLGLVFLDVRRTAKTLADLL